MAEGLSEDELRQQRSAFLDAREATLPFKKDDEVPQVAGEGHWSERNAETRGAGRFVGSLQPALAGDAFDEVFYGGERPHSTIERIGDGYSQLQVEGRDPKTSRRLEGRALANHVYDESLEAARQLKERLEGRTGGRKAGGE